MYDYAKNQGFTVTFCNSKSEIYLKTDNDNLQLHTIVSKKPLTKQPLHEGQRKTKLSYNRMFENISFEIAIRLT